MLVMLMMVEVELNKNKVYNYKDKQGVWGIKVI